MNFNNYELAIDLFQQCRYAEAVEKFIQAYNEGIMQEEIVQILYDCFITPNDQEFRKNYEENRQEITNMPYEETKIDFIPVSDTEYYLFDKENAEFLGGFSMEEWKGRPEEKEFDSLLIADMGDIRLVIDEMRKSDWNVIYYLLNEQKEIFCSFLKLPGFKELYLEKIVCFQDTNQMKVFFETYSDFYLPRSVIAIEPEEYMNIITEIHNQRIRDMETPRKDICLSTCIPSYNHGHKALKSVMHILENTYDSEIEVVVSDNCSTENTEGYQQIAELQDSRVRYVRVEDSRSDYATNIHNVLKTARGRFLMLASDEDMLILENLDNYLKYLKNHQSAGVIYADGIGSNFRKAQETVENSLEYSIEKAMNMNYVTGVTINGEILRRFDLVHEYQKRREETGNIFQELYAHCVFGMMACQYGIYVDSGIILWDACEDLVEEDIIKEKPLISYMHPANRIKETEGLYNF